MSEASNSVDLLTMVLFSLHHALTRYHYFESKYFTSYFLSGRVLEVWNALSTSAYGHLNEKSIWLAGEQPTRLEILRGPRPGGRISGQVL